MKPRQAAPHPLPFFFHIGQTAAPRLEFLLPLSRLIIHPSQSHTISQSFLPHSPIPSRSFPLPSATRRTGESSPSPLTAPKTIFHFLSRPIGFPKLESLYAPLPLQRRPYHQPSVSSTNRPPATALLQQHVHRCRPFLIRQSCPPSSINSDGPLLVQQRLPPSAPPPQMKTKKGRSKREGRGAKI